MMKKIFIASAIATSLLVPSFASTVMAEPVTPQEKIGQSKRPHDVKPHEMGKPKHMGKAGDMGKHREMHALHMAQKLAAMETAIGIRSEQLNVWRAYTASFFDMIDIKPEPMDDKKQDKIFGEPMADHAIERAKKAEKFKTAANALRQSLDADQLKRMQHFANEPMGDRRMKGPMRGDGHMQPKPPMAPNDQDQGDDAPDQQAE